VNPYARTQRIDLPLLHYWRVWADERRTQTRAFGLTWSEKHADQAIEEVFRKERAGEYG
jgi:hypothetical protein